MPSTKVIRANDQRDILVHKGVLLLRDYKWNLKSLDGELLATQKFRVSSSGRVGAWRCKGRYTLYQHAILSCGGLGDVPVYKQDGGDGYLYLRKDGDVGFWAVSPVIGGEYCWLMQARTGESPSPIPDKSLKWQYGDVM